MKKKRSVLVLMVCWCLSLLLGSMLPATAEITIDGGTDAGGDEADAVADPEVGGVSRLTLINRDKLHGTLVDILPDKHGIRWQHPSVTEPIDLSMSAASLVELGPQKLGKGKGHSATVRLTNDDILRGDVVSMDDEKLVMNTWYAGKIEIKRPMINIMNPSTAVSVLAYEGPTDLASWTATKRGNVQTWGFKKGALYSVAQSPIGRTIDNMPDRSSIEFSLKWRGYASFFFCFYTDNLRQYYGNCYRLQVSGATVYLQACTRNGSSRNLGNVNVPALGTGQSGKAKIAILTDKQKKTFTLMINDQMIKQWTDSSAFSGAGKGILFYPQTQGGMQIRDIRIAKWDGRIPQALGEGSGTKEDFVRFVNNDKVSGSLLSIVDAAVKFKTAYATLDIPLKRIAEIEMSSERTERARRNKEDVKAHFRAGGAVTVRLGQLKANLVKGGSENFGPVTMPLKAFRRIEFNIYRDKEDEEEDDFTF